MTRNRSKPTPRAVLLLGVVLALAWAALGIRAQDASSLAADQLGNVGGKAPPSCPTPDGTTPDPADPKFCQALASVTAFQMIANGKRAAFKLPSDGRIVAWSANLSEPTESEANSFTTTLKFGEPTGRIAVLKQIDRSKFKLTKQSPAVELTDEFGRKPVFTLNHPLRAKKGSIVAFSTSSWTPNLAHDGTLTADDDKWRASRNRTKCGTDPNKSSTENRQDILNSKAQRKVGTTRTYGCTYNLSRVLYQAYYVPDSK